MSTEQSESSSTELAPLNKSLGVSESNISTIDCIVAADSDLVFPLRRKIRLIAKVPPDCDSCVCPSDARQGLVKERKKVNFSKVTNPELYNERNNAQKKPTQISDEQTLKDSNGRNLEKAT